MKLGHKVATVFLMRMKVGSLLVYRLAVWSCDVYFALNGGIKGFNADRIPKEGGVIVAAVHLTAVDPVALACTMRHRRLLALAKEELWKNKIFGWLIGQIGAFPIKRGEGDTESIRMSIAVLEDGQALLVFPEGTRGDGKTLLPMNRGVAMLAKKTGVPVVPVGIVGTKPKRRGVEVAYGQPLFYEDFKGGSEKETRERFLTALENQIAELCTKHGLPIKTASESKRKEPADLPGPQAESPTA
jgi:1-acyl-sn-glycerol-3-phosphate acyltransferase